MRIVDICERTIPISRYRDLSWCEAKLLDRYGGLDRSHDILLFDPVHCYGVPGYLRIIEHLERCGWPRTAFWPHGGHLFCLHLVAALGLGGAEANPLCFQPFGGYADETCVVDGVLFANRMMKVLPSMAVFGKTAKGLALTAA